MPKWIQIPAEPLKFQPYQDAFWKARRARICRPCKLEYDSPPHAVCPQCNKKGLRKFDRLTLLSGRRGGKTRAGALAVAEEMTIPNVIWWACAPTNPKLHRYVIPAFQQIIPPEWVRDYSSEYQDLWLKNGSLLHFQTLEDPDQGRGQGLDGVWIDEICELTKRHWEVLSPSLTERRGAAIATSSPRSFDWVWEEFYQRAEKQEPGYWAARYATSENPIISSEEVARARATMTPAMFEQEYMADFVIFTGAVYGGLVEPQVLRGDEMIKQLIPEWPKIDGWRAVTVGLDTGADHPFGAVKIVSTERGLVVVGEYLERDKTFIQHANTLKRLAGNSNTRWAINKNEKQPSIELAQHGIYCQRAENDVVAGTERVKSWLVTRQLWFIEDACPKTIQQMKSYRWAENRSPKDDQARKEKVFKVNDELPDCLRYALMTWPVLPTHVPEEEEKPRDLSGFSDEQQASIKRLRRIEGAPPKKEQEVVGDFWS